MKKNQLIRLICFSLCVLTVVCFLCHVFHYDKARMRNPVLTYAKLEKNTIDTVLIGTSGIHCSYIPGRAYDKYGITTYNCTIDGMRAWGVLPMMKYVLRYQKPQLMIMDMRPFIDSGDSTYNEQRSRYFNEIFPVFSYFRFIGVNQSLKYLSQLDENTGRFDMSYLFNVVRYHDMWQDTLSFSVLKNSYAYTFGFRLNKGELSTKTIPESAYSDERLDLLWYSEECLDEVIEYAEKKGVQLLFINTPMTITEERAKRMNTIHDKLDSFGIPYIDFCTKSGEEQYHFDKSEDFRDKSHTNYTGAKKVTDIVAQYVLDNYDVPDRSNDPSCDYYKDAYEQTVNEIKRLKKAVSSS
ncbi:MAG: hypothetical protein K6C36_05800 [Clostridia bacterium]|nr:hypothetical protein [Clostridia bacterium]